MAQQAPTPEVRPGPRPLPLHLATANMILLSSFAAWQTSKLVWPPLNGPQSPPGRVNPAENPPGRNLLSPNLFPLPLPPDLLEAIRQIKPELFGPALLSAAADRLEGFQRGIRAYREHPYARAAEIAPAIWKQGASRLLDHGAGLGPAPAVLLVPSLVNRHYILDLAPGQSLASYLAGRGLHPLLLDWGAPAELELGFDLDAYIVRLASLLRHLAAERGGPIHLLGYCMGGNLALAAALAAPEAVASLALLATPWDFHAGGAHQAALVKALAPQLVPPPENPGGRLSPLAVDTLQGFFWALDPQSALRKFDSFGRMEPGSDAARRFVAMEDWLNDGIELAGAVARQCLLGWYGDNGPARLRWKVAGQVVDPARWPGPSLVVLPERDKLVPKAGAEALWHALPNAARHDAPSGHIGMMVGPRAEAGLWAPLADWLLTPK